MTRLDLTARDLHHLISPVLPHASLDDKLPILHNIRLEIDRQVLYAVATDRYTLAAERMRIDEPVDDVAINLDRKDVAVMLRLFPVPKPDDFEPKLTVVIEAGTNSADLNVDSEDGTRLRLHGYNDAFEPFPNWRRTLGPLLHRDHTEATAVVALSPTFVARWAKAARKHERLRVFVGPEPTSAILVTVEDHFIGAWQPVRDLDSALPADRWLEDNPWLDEVPPPGVDAETGEIVGTEGGAE